MQCMCKIEVIKIQEYKMAITQSWAKYYLDNYSNKYVFE